MTEEEARTKWCPMVRYHSRDSGAVFNRDDAGHDWNDIHKCIASDCMMWTHDVETQLTLNGMAVMEMDTGHCGLAK